MLNAFGECQIVDVAEVGEEKLLVHDESRNDPALAFALSRLASQPTMPTPIGVFRDVRRSTYEDDVQRQIVTAVDRQGPGNLAALLASGSTWDVA
jgi:2-oxoglutarate ferredoxin oxidoreductase subunit beta